VANYNSEELSKGMLSSIHFVLNLIRFAINFERCSTSNRFVTSFCCVICMKNTVCNIARGCKPCLDSCRIATRSPCSFFDHFTSFLCSLQRMQSHVFRCFKRDNRGDDDRQSIFLPLSLDFAG
jgi:hypothetical protein